MKAFAILICSFLFISLSAWGQSFIIRGSITDSSTQTVLEEADVLLFVAGSSKPFLQTRSGKEGFTFRNLPERKYSLVVLAMGYRVDTTHIAVKKDGDTFFRIVLSPQQNELGNVIVKATPRPVTLKGDTLSFNADAYSLQPNAQMEDLLRQLPGVDVDKDGNITFQGQRVDRIMLNGKEFFIGDIKNANSLSAEIIASIETFSTQSDAARFAGIKEPSETRTLNIKTKKGMDNSLTGSLYAGKGQRENYAAGGNFTRLSPDLMMKGTVKRNNINNRFVGVENKNQGPQSGIQSVSDLDFTLMKKWEDKVTLNLSFTGINQKTEVLQTTSRRTFFSDSSLQENRQGQAFTDNRAYPLNLKITYNANPGNVWEYSGGLTIFKNSSNNNDTAAVQTLSAGGTGYISSRAQIFNQSARNALGFSNQLDWRHRFTKAGRSIQLSGSQVAQNGDNVGALLSRLNNFNVGIPDSEVLLNQQYLQRNNVSRYTASVIYTEPLSTKNSLTFTYAFTTYQQVNDKVSNDYDSVTGGYTHPNPLTTNRFTNRNISHRVDGIFSSNTRKISYTLGLGWQYSIFNSVSFSPDRHVNQNFSNLIPRATLNLNLVNGKSLILRYSGNGKTPEIDQLQPLPDLSNPLFVKSGNPALKQSFTHSANFFYSGVNSQKFTSFSAGFTGDITTHQIVPSITLLPGGVQQQQFVNVNGTYHVGIGGFYSFVPGVKRGNKSNGSINIRFSYGREVGFINAKQNFTNSFSFSPTLKLGYNLDKKLMAELVGTMDVALNRYSVIPQQNTRSWRYNSMLHVSYQLPLNIYLQGSYTWNRLSTSGLLPPQTFSMLNAAIYKRLFRSQNWQLRLSAFDVLNTNRNFTQNATQNYIYTQQTNQLQRMFLLSLVYDFKVFPGLKK